MTNGERFIRAIQQRPEEAERIVRLPYRLADREVDVEAAEYLDLDDIHEVQALYAALNL